MDIHAYITPSTQYVVNNWLFGRGNVVKVQEGTQNSQDDGKGRKTRKQLSKRQSLQHDLLWGGEKQEKAQKQKPERAKLRKAQRPASTQDQGSRQSWLSETTIPAEASPKMPYHKDKERERERERVGRQSGGLGKSSSLRSTLQPKPRYNKPLPQLPVEADGGRHKKGNSVASDITLVGTASGMSPWMDKRDSAASFCQFDSAAALYIPQTQPISRLSAGPGLLLLSPGESTTANTPATSSCTQTSPTSQPPTPACPTTKPPTSSLRTTTKTPSRRHSVPSPLQGNTTMRNQKEDTDELKPSVVSKLAGKFYFPPNPQPHLPIHFHQQEAIL